MIKIIKFSRPGCQPCVTQEMILHQLEKKVYFQLEERNVLEIDRSILVENGITGVPHLMIYWDNELLYNQSGLVRLEKLLEILTEKLA